VAATTPHGTGVCRSTPKAFVEVADHPFEHYSSSSSSSSSFLKLGYFKKFKQNIIQFQLKNLVIPILPPNKRIGIVIPFQLLIPSNTLNETQVDQGDDTNENSPHRKEMELVFN
jgi:hypothetical protein